MTSQFQKSRDIGVAIHVLGKIFTNDAKMALKHFTNIKIGQLFLKILAKCRNDVKSGCF